MGGDVRKLVVSLAAGAVCALAIAVVALGAGRTTVWTAALSSGQEVPKQVVKDTAAHGLFKGTLSNGKLTWTLTFAKLTGAPFAAHIHMAPMGTAGPVVVPLCPPANCKTSPVKGTSMISAALQAAFKKHQLYVNVHTAKNPNGEIRGQLAAG
jgi:hypothetical protein